MQKSKSNDSSAVFAAPNAKNFILQGNTIFIEIKFMQKKAFHPTSGTITNVVTLPCVLNGRASRIIYCRLCNLTDRQTKKQEDKHTEDQTNRKTSREMRRRNCQNVLWSPESR
jgi:hypothetical protein